MKLAAGFLRQMITKIKIPLGRLLQVHPAHHVYPYFFRRFIKPNGVPLAFMHFLTLLIAHQPMTQNCFRRRESSSSVLIAINE